MNDAVLDALELEIKQDEPTSSKNVKKLYQSCLNESIFHRHNSTYFKLNNFNTNKDQIETDGEEWLKNLLETEFGGWTLINQTSNLTDDYIELMAKFHRLNGQPFFNIDTIQNPNNRGVSLIKVKILFINK